MTLGSALDNHLEVIVGCNSCTHRIVADLVSLIDRLGRAFPVPELARRGRCEKCGARGGYISVSGYKPPVTS